MRIGTVMLLIVPVGLSLLPVAHGQDLLFAVRAQLMIALYASDLAQGGTAVSTAHRHLRQMINCLEGPQGKNFTVAAGNPCQRQGNGILVDLRAVVDAGNAKVGKALRFSSAAHTFALQGLASTNVDEAQTYARIAAFDIGNALEALD